MMEQIQPQQALDYVEGQEISLCITIAISRSAEAGRVPTLLVLVLLLQTMKLPPNDAGIEKSSATYLRNISNEGREW